MIRENDNILRLKDVLKRVPLGRSTLYRRMDAGTFPRQVALGSDPNGNATLVGWYEADINAWVADPTGWRPGEAAS
jgi:prophage regulatory protein